MTAIIFIWLVVFSAAYIGNVFYIIKYLKPHKFKDVLKALGCAFGMLISNIGFVFFILSLK